MINLLTNGGTYLQTFKTIRQCANFFSTTEAHIKSTLRNKTGIRKNGITYRIEVANGKIKTDI